MVISKTNGRSIWCYDWQYCFHIKKIISSGELDELSTSAENAQVRLEGNREIKRTVKIYNLDMIISVGYHVNSKKGYKTVYIKL